MSNMHNINIERALLSSILFEPFSPEVQEMFSCIKASDFYLPYHQSFYTACHELQREEKPIDDEFIRNKLVRSGSFDEVAMLDIMSANPITNVKAYINDLVEMSQKRSLASIATKITQELVENDAAPLELIDDTIRRIEMVAENGSITIKRKNINEMVSHEQEFMCKNWIPIPKGTMSMFTAPGGTGKTWLVLQLATRLVQEDSQRKVFLWLSEDPEGTVRGRHDSIQNKILSLYGAQSINNRIDVSTDDPLLLLETQGNTAKLSSKFYAMKRELREYDVIVIDPLLAFYGGDENNNSQARIFMQPFLNWCRSEGKTIIFLHHSKKGDSNGVSKSRGAGAIIDAVRCVYDMEKITVRKNDKQVPDESKLSMRRFTLTKDNYGAARFTDGFTFDREITPLKGAQVVEVEYEESIDMPVIR